MKSTNDCATKDLALPLAQSSHLSPLANLCTFEISPAAVWEDWLEDSGCKKWCHGGTKMLASLSGWTDVLYRQTVLHYYVKYPNQSNFSQVWSVQTEWRLLQIKPSSPFNTADQTKTMESLIQGWKNFQYLLLFAVEFIFNIHTFWWKIFKPSDDSVGRIHKTVFRCWSVIDSPNWSVASFWSRR